jgi:hypothetical protein
MSANQLPAADEGSFCAKRGKNRSGKRFRQESGAISAMINLPPPD